MGTDADQADLELAAKSIEDLTDLVEELNDRRDAGEVDEPTFVGLHAKAAALGLEHQFRLYRRYPEEFAEGVVADALHVATIATKAASLLTGSAGADCMEAAGRALAIADEVSDQERSE